MSADALRRTLEHKFTDMRIETVADTGTFNGYASVFNEVDLGRDTVAPGAFAMSLATKRPSDIRMLFQHDPDIPIGVWKAIAEDARGLRVTGCLALDTAKGREVHELLRIGAIDGLSIGFKTVRATADPATGIRTITQADLWEISVVTFPMLPSARIEHTKSSRLPTIREFERMLVRDAGLTRSEAKCAVAHGYSHLVTARDAQDDQTKSLASDEAFLAARFRDAARRIQPR